MDFDIFCDRCSSQFDEDERIPLVLERCGHSICRACQPYIKRARMCNVCDEPQEHPENLAVNKPLLKMMRILKKRDGSSGQNQPTSQINKDNLCEIHSMKEVEYYCKDCKALICPECMFSDHNGHNFILIEDAVRSLSNEMNNLFTSYDQLRSLEASKSARNDRNVKEIQNKLELNKNTQIKFIRQGFDKIVEALVQRKNDLIQENIEKYDAEVENYARFSRTNSSRDKATDLYRAKMEEIQAMKDDRSKGETLKKIRMLNAFNQKFGNEVREAQRISENTNKLESMDSSSYKMPQLGEEFTPKTIDSTSAISYILNMTLENQSLNRGTGKQSQMAAMNKGASGSQLPIHGKYRNSHEANKPTISANNIHNYHQKAMNTGKKTVDTEKGAGSEREPGMNFQPNYNNSPQNFMQSHVGNNTREERKQRSNEVPLNQVSKKSSEGASYIQQGKATGFYCIGDLPFMIFYHTDSKKWSKIEFSEESAYKGGLKYPSIIRLGLSDEIIITGGCDNYTGEASESVFKANVSKVETFKKISSMSNRRYGHCSACLKGYLFVIGGFDHQDTETTSPSTLASCEKYNPTRGKWSNVADLIHPVSFASIATVEDTYLYLFGGFEDYTTVDIIQKYNFLVDSWDLLSIKLPVKLAKMGAATIDSDTILVVGGIYEDSNNETPLSLISSCYKFKLGRMIWQKAGGMKNKRTLNSSLFHYEDQIYAIGSSNKGACEKYDIQVNRWINIPGYDKILPNNDLQSFSVCLYDHHDK
ncbi:unnamed protein product [Moneuplotes crassus]|uniref:Kelch motif family protein n=1 Tax=Euplotes crassus TaxID=5936 RepID=A0AAD2D901_EUPCR|nr:unnamed protein product [Moneuplotes crassus]